MAKAIACACAVVGLSVSHAIAHAAEGDYQIYPTPHTVTSANGEIPLSDTITTVVAEGIDADTVTRMNGVLDLKGLKAAQSDSVPAGSGETSLLVGIKGSKGAVDAHVDKLAKAGNESKCRFVFALHPFMSNPITNGNYDASVKTLKDKFTQVMDHGVRQIAILADDARDQGKDLYIKLCKEMTDWLHEQQKAENADGAVKYPGLKDTLIFCPVNYMGHGERWYSRLPETVQVINTGGRVWGKIDDGFASAFQRSSGVAPWK